MQDWQRLAESYDRNEDFVDRSVRRMREDTSTLLFARTMMCLVAMLGISAVTSLLSWEATIPTPLFWIIFVVLLVLIFVIKAMEKDGAAMIPASLFAALWGVLLGPCFAMYSETLGAGSVTFAIGLTTGIMAVCGAVASIFTIPYRKMEGPLLLALFGLIIYGVWTAFTGIPSTEIDMGYSILGAVVFVLYFLADFARLYHDGKHGVRGWGAATGHAVGLYLDYLNLLLFILRIMGNSRK